MNEQLSLFGSGSVVDVSHSKQYQKKDDHEYDPYYKIFYGDNITVHCKDCWKFGTSNCDVFKYCKLKNPDPDAMCAVGEIEPMNLEHYEPEISKTVGYWYTGMLNKYARRMDGSFGFCCCDSSDSRIGKTDSIDCKDCQFHYNGDTECEHNKWKWERAVWKGDKNEEH